MPNAHKSQQPHNNLMDKVYAKLLSVSILLSLCGAGVSMTCTDVSAAIFEALSEGDSNSGKCIRAIFPKAEETATSSTSARKSSLSRLRSIFSGLTDRLSSWRKVNVEGATRQWRCPCADTNLANSLPATLALCGNADPINGLFPQYSIICSVFPPLSLRSVWQPLALKCRAGPDALA